MKFSKKFSRCFVVCAVLFAVFAQQVTAAFAAGAAELEKFGGVWLLDLRDDNYNLPYINIILRDGNGYMSLGKNTAYTQKVGVSDTYKHGFYQMQFFIGSIVEKEIHDGFWVRGRGSFFDEKTGALLLHTEHFGNFPAVATAHLVPGKPDRLIVKGSCINHNTNDKLYTFEYEFLREGQGVKSGKGRGQTTVADYRPEWWWMQGGWKSTAGDEMRVNFNVSPHMSIDTGGETYYPTVEWDAEKRAYVIYQAFSTGARKVTQGYIRTPSGTSEPSDTIELEYINESDMGENGYGKNGLRKYSATLSKETLNK